MRARARARVRARARARRRGRGRGEGERQERERERGGRAGVTELFSWISIQHVKGSRSAFEHCARTGYEHASETCVRDSQAYTQNYCVRGCSVAHGKNHNHGMFQALMSRPPFMTSDEPRSSSFFGSIGVPIMVRRTAAAAVYELNAVSGRGFQRRSFNGHNANCN